MVTSIDSLVRLVVVVVVVADLYVADPATAAEGNLDEWNDFLLAVVIR